jgi:YebC/PmpR family DNA-binding regulatory protein
VSGHSKWANIKHRKEAADKKRGAEFTKLARAITVAAREGGGDIDANFALRLAVDKARGANMPRDNIDRAIARGTGDLKGDQLERVVYEGYGPSGAAILIDALTDNRHRTVAEIRHLFSRHGGSLGESGSVAWQFESRGMITLAAGDVDPDDVALAAIDAGAMDIEVDTDLVTVYTEPTALRDVQTSLAAAGYDTADSELALIPSNTIALEDKQTMSVLKLAEALEELDDVDRVWTNVDISDAVAEAYAGA